ncbi:MAG: amidohydrolase family protein [Acidobacteria bacterium]|nr:amidohydrolase family protein [Acidobacteriota bacterium]
MNRRQFLLSAAAAFSGRIIDTHTHFYDPARPRGVPWPGKNDPLLYRTVLPKHYKAIAQPLGVTGTVVVEASPWLEDNQWVLDLAADDPFLVGLVGHLEPGRPEFRSNLDRFRKNRLFLGIRVGAAAVAKALADAAFAADFERLAGANLQADVLGPAAMFPDLVRFADRFPELRIVIDHLPMDGLPADLGKRPNVYAKVSGVLRRVDGRTPTGVEFYREALDGVWSLFGPDRVIYGSNWPVCEKVGSYADVQKVVLAYFTAKGPEAAERYFWKNSQAAYRWQRGEHGS